MEQVKGVVKHMVLAKFKEGVPEEEIEKHIKDYANLLNHIEHMKSFQWGTDVSIENLHQGFTHIFEVTFETLDGRSAYVAHPAHVDFGTAFLTILEKIVVVDFVPTLVKL
ncbi:stress-response A/B barrel domain-containing protein HS1 [Populus alba]|uniref:Stress-response A/B barrel domain-containing protein n=1 Tax=Populus alba TaxID=43335 RepID=A0A4U5MWP0_POPAL|nr:stress-response A/B barrel domain-containing protein HS1-like [Populus alba]TKR74310.1 putative protein Pop3 [Populus alba]